MGNAPTITGAPGYGDQPDIITRRVKAGEAIVSGAVLTFSNAAGDGYTVIENGGDNFSAGIALSAASAGDWLDMQVFGLNQVAMTCGATDITLGQLLIADAANGVVAGVDADASGTGNGDGLYVGVALEAESSTTLAAGTVMICTLLAAGGEGCIEGMTGYDAQEYVVKRTVKAGEAITAGNVVAWSGSADDGITVVIAGAASVPCGVALTDAASGDFFEIQTKGLNQVPLVTDGGVADGEHLFAAASGAVDSGVVTTIGNDDNFGQVVGVALADDSSTAQAINTAILFPLAGY